MTHSLPADLWRDFPKTAPAFEARFATEEDCRAYWIMARWGGKPACGRSDAAPRITDFGHVSGEDAQAFEDVVPRHLRNLGAAHEHFR